MSIIQGSIKKETEKFIFRYFIMIVIFFVVLIIVLAIVFLAVPMYQRITEKNIEFNNLQTELDSRENVLNRQRDLTSIYYEIDRESDEVKILNELLPREKDLPEYYLMITDLIYSDDIAMDITQISVRDVQKAVTNPAKDAGNSSEALSKIGMMEIDVSIPEGGDYQRLKTLLRTIESTKPIMDIMKLTDNAPEFSGYSLSIRTYYLKD